MRGRISRPLPLPVWVPLDLPSGWVGIRYNPLLILLALLLAALLIDRALSRK